MLCRADDGGDYHSEYLPYSEGDGHIYIRFKAVAGKIGNYGKGISVYSAGVGQPLRLLRQYYKLVGQPVEVVLKSGEKILATLKEVSPEAITIGYTEKRLVEGKKRKIDVEVEESYTFDQIKTTKEYLDFK